MWRPTPIVFTLAALVMIVTPARGADGPPSELRPGRGGRCREEGGPEEGRREDRRRGGQTSRVSPRAAPSRARPRRGRAHGARARSRARRRDRAGRARVSGGGGAGRHCSRTRRVPGADGKLQIRECRPRRSRGARRKLAGLAARDQIATLDLGKASFPPCSRRSSAISSVARRADSRRALELASAADDGAPRAREVASEPRPAVTFSVAVGTCPGSPRASTARRS